MKKLSLLVLLSLIGLPASAQGDLWGMVNSGGSTTATIFKTSYDGQGLVKKGGFPLENPGGGPRGDVMLAANGKLYGLTINGGTFDDGVLFEYDPSSGAYQVKVNLDNTTTGAGAIGNLTAAPNGKLYGMTGNGGANNIGVLFEYDPITGLFTNKHDFDFATGGLPQGSLCLADNGKLYGLTQQGGLGVGVIFEYDPTLNTYAKKFEFDVVNGSFPSGTLMKASNGKLYGTAGAGSANIGVIFEFNPLTGSFSKKFDFTVVANGKYPVGSLQAGSNGKLYGMTINGGSSGVGVIYEFDPSNNTYTKKADFTGIANGAYPNGSLLLSSNGKFYGMTRQGGTGSIGTLFEYDPSANSLTKRFDFDGQHGSTPYGSLVTGANGKLYGMTNGGTVGFGTLFEFDQVTNTLTKKIDFSSLPQGGNPTGGLIQASNGKFYGLTTTGGAFGSGVLFEYDSGTTVITPKVHFDGVNNGANPEASLRTGPDGKLYGLTSQGGAWDNGVLFAFDPLNGTYSKKVDFDGPTKGSLPQGNLLMANGKIYGLTKGGGLSFGVLFEYDPVTSTYQKKIDFTGANGSQPTGSLTLAANGKLYGQTISGGLFSSGVLFEYDPVAITTTNKVDFDGNNGYIPVGGLTQADNGKLYGLTRQGGDFNYGVLFEFDPTTGAFADKVHFNGGAKGRSPYGSLTLNGNGKLYGMTSDGGSNASGVLFEYDPATSLFVNRIDFGDLINGYNPYGDLLYVKSRQSIQFIPPGTKVMGTSPFSLSATATSGLPVTFSTASDKITIAGNQVTLVKPGRVTISVAQAGTSNFSAATSVEQSFCIRPIKPTLTLSENGTALPLLTSNAASGNQWFWNGAVITGATQATYSISKPGTYKVQVSADDCASDFSADQVMVVTGDLESQTETHLIVYPNPASDWLTVSSNHASGIKEVSILQINGAVRDTQTTPDKEARFNVSEYPSGLYLVRVKTESGTGVLKWVKR
jgi:uncharacterized repeat protein (TIGR03803 family)